MEKQKILIVDDDENIAELISLYLQKECFDTETVGDGLSAVKLFPVYKPDLILLDLMLPGMDGYDVCQELRKTSRVPIIILSAKSEVFDKVLSLKIGADDYIQKPFNADEMVARVHAVLRRAANPVDSAPVNEQIPDQGHTGKFVEYEDLLVNISNYTVYYQNNELEMPPMELQLLYFLASKPNQVFTRDQLLNQLWGYDFAGDTRTVDVHIKRLREKLVGKHNWSIATVWRIGYKFEVK